MHGLPHQYAQTRHETLTGWSAPAAGPPVRELSDARRPPDTAARKSSTESVGKSKCKLRLFISEDKQLGMHYFTTSISLPKLSTTSYLTFSGA